MTSRELPDTLNPIWEWELLREPIEFIPTDSGDLPPAIEKVHVFRDESDYGLRFEATGTGTLGSVLPEERDHSGTSPFLPPAASINGQSDRWRMSVRIDNPTVDKRSWNSRGGVNLGGMAFGRLSDGRAVPGLELVALEDREPAVSRSLWLAGSRRLTRGWSMWPRGTEREASRIIRRVRDGGTATREITGKPGRTSLDCAFFGLDRLGSVVVASVPKEVHPDWFEGIELEYQLSTDRNNTPTPDERALAEAIGFVLGAPLVPLGRTDFDSNGRVASAAAWYPHQAELMRVTCNVHPNPPCRLSNPDHRQDTEQVLQAIVPAWLKHRDGLQLDTVSYLLHHASVLPIDIRLVLYMAVVQTLAQSVLTSDDTECPQSWRRQVEGLASRYGLEIGAPEWQALRARHEFAHAWSKPHRSLAWHAHVEAAFRTLVHRVLLASLGYKGEYIDYSDRSEPESGKPNYVGHPTRPLAEPARGRDGDGKPAPDE